MLLNQEIDMLTVLLSGILERQANDVIATYAPWIKLTVADHSDGWVLLVGQR